MKNKYLLFISPIYILMSNVLNSEVPSKFKMRNIQPFRKMQSRKPIFIQGQESYPIRPVIKISSKYKKTRDIKVIAYLRSKKWESAESFFQVLAYKTRHELLHDTKLKKECAQTFGLDSNKFSLALSTMPHDNSIILHENKPVKTATKIKLGTQS